MIAILSEYDTVQAVVCHVILTVLLWYWGDSMGHVRAGAVLFANFYGLCVSRSSDMEATQGG